MAHILRQQTGVADSRNPTDDELVRCYSLAKIQVRCPRPAGDTLSCFPLIIYDNPGNNSSISAHRNMLHGMLRRADLHVGIRSMDDSPRPSWEEVTHWQEVDSHFTAAPIEGPLNKFMVFTKSGKSAVEDYLTVKREFLAAKIGAPSLDRMYAVEAKEALDRGLANMDYNQIQVG